ncbi:hypothetical protein SAMN05421681_103315 [Lysobacter enzymogenes]|nr:hypothetical protein SAMN05421681_103315 [Lysobacter enzymogenes]
MTQAEFEAWRAYFRLHPFDDLHRFHRPAALIARAAGGGEIEPKLDWLEPPPIPPGFSDPDARTLRAFGLTPPTRH